LSLLTGYCSDLSIAAFSLSLMFLKFAAVCYMVHRLVSVVAGGFWVLYYFELVEVRFYIAMSGYCGSEVRGWVNSQLQSIFYVGEEGFSCRSFCGRFSFVLPLFETLFF
jgi:hypothetical protein